MRIQDIKYRLNFILISGYKLVILFIFLFPICGLSQELLKGSVFAYDKKAKIPLDSVYIYNFYDTIPTISDSNGYFELNLPIKKGKHYQNHTIKNIKKEGYLILNDSEIEFINKKSELQILMCKEETYNNLLNEFIRIGLSNYEDKNKHKLNEYRLQKEKKLISETKYSELLSNYYDDYISYKKSLNQTSDYFAKIDKIRFDSVIQNCISLILENKLQEAIDICLKQNYTQQYIYNYDKKKKEYIKHHIDFEINLIRFSSLSDKFEKVGDIYYNLAIYNLESIPILIEYANFLYEQKNFDKAIGWYNQILKRNNSPFITANIKNILGSIYFLKEEYSKSEEMYLSAIETYDSIIPKDYYSYSPSKADAITNLAILYKSTRNFDEAISPFEEALKINTEFSSLYPNKYLSLLAINLMNLASLQHELKNDSLSINLYLDAIIFFDSLSKLKQDNYKPYHATSLNNLGLIFYKNQKYQEALDAINLSCRIFEQLSIEYPSQYLSQLATIKLNLASISKEILNHSKAEKLYLEVINIYSDLSNIKPIESLSQISSTQNLLGLLYSSIGDYEKSERTLSEALIIRKRLAEIDIDNNLAKVADIQNNLGSVYEYTEKYSKAIEIYKQSIEIYNTLAKNGYYFTEKAKEIEENIKRLNQLYIKNN